MSLGFLSPRRANIPPHNIQLLQQACDRPPGREYRSWGIIGGSLPHFLVHFRDMQDLLVDVKCAGGFEEFVFALFDVFPQGAEEVEVLL